MSRKRSKKKTFTQTKKPYLEWEKIICDRVGAKILDPDAARELDKLGVLDKPITEDEAYQLFGVNTVMIKG